MKTKNSVVIISLVVLIIFVSLSMREYYTAPIDSGYQIGFPFSIYEYAGYGPATEEGPYSFSLLGLVGDITVMVFLVWLVTATYQKFRKQS